MAKHRSGYVRIDIDDIIDEIEDDVLVAELENRRLITQPAGASYDQDLVKDAYQELRVGRVAEAMSILDRLLNPKWTNRHACETAYDKRQGIL